MRVFEVGRVFRAWQRGHRRSRCSVGGLAFGPAPARAMGGEAARGVDLFDVKGDLEAIAARCRRDHGGRPASGAAIRAGRPPSSIDGRRRRLAGRTASAPRAALRAAASAPVRLRARPRRAGRAPRAGGPARVAACRSVRRDLALVVDETVPVQALLDALSAAEPAVSSPPCDSFDVYRGGSADERQEKRCDSGGYAGYCTYFDRRRDRADRGAAGRRVLDDQFGATLATPEIRDDADQSRTGRPAVRTARAQQARGEGHGRALLRGIRIALEAARA